MAGEADEPLFIAHREKGKGLIVEASIEHTKATGSRYIRLIVDFGGADQRVMCVMGRIAYTVTVIRLGWPTEQSGEEANVARLVGMMVKVQWEHVISFDGKTYAAAYPMEAF